MSIDNLVEDLTSQLAKRKLRDWQPKKPNFRQSSSPEIVKKCCLLADLEVTVGEWVTESLKALDNPNLIEMAKSNVSDEIKHERQINYLKDYLKAKESDASREIVKIWQSLTPSFITAYALEMGVFFQILPILNVKGDAFCSTVARWISSDEVFHVYFNGKVANALGQKLTQEHLLAVKKTLDFLYDDEAEASKAFERAIGRFKTGKDLEMEKMSLPTGIAFFEQNDKRSIAY